MDSSIHHNTELSLNAFASDAESEAVKSFLLQLGYTLRSSHVSASNIASQQADILVLVLGDSHSSEKTVEQFLEKHSGLPCLGIFCSRSQQHFPNLVERCCEFVHWPCHADELVLRMKRLLQNPAPDSVMQPEKVTEIDDFSVNQLVGQSHTFQETLRLAKTYARCQAPVLIEGETGTGKEMFARAIHYYSERRDYPFIPVNCGALPDNLIENELFGHVKGAYTDATSSQTGLIAQANGGTLFLDEIETLTPKAQIVLLRFLQESEYKPLGSSQTLNANVRIVTASNIGIAELVTKGLLRQDLYFRLNILSLPLPPLRDRYDDIVVLATFFLEQYLAQYKLGAKFFSAAVRNWMLSYHWPGNVRELENLIHRAVLTATDTQIELQHIQQPSSLIDDLSSNASDEAYNFDISFHDAKSKVIEDFERRYLHHLMQQTGGNVTLAARHASKERRAFGKLLKKYGIDRQHFSK